MKKKILLPPLIILVIVIVAGVGLAGASLLIGNTGDNSPTTAIDLQRGLVGWWKFDGNASDSTPNQNDGTASNVTLTTDRKGQANKAYSFDGNDYIQVSDSPSFDTVESNNRITVSAWVKRNSDQGPSTPNFRTIATRGAYSAVGNSWIFVWDSTNSELEFVVNANANRITESLSLTADTWYHVVATYDGSNLRLYFNGALLGTPVAEATGFGGSTNNTIYMGSDESGSDRYWRGSLGDVRIYNRALSTTEITALYDSYNPGIQVSDLQKGLVGHWKMDGNA
ncbi:MAG: LamG domain-containing protein, partial [Candidatus Levybacteria bacterium]|nr:LamG domain-containing protein [Candidatus Levybacteria bacterium]